MRLSFYDPQPYQNEYVSLMFLGPMMAYARDNGIEQRLTDRLVPESGRATVCNADYLTPEVVQHFKENNCPLIGFSCIDSAYLSQTIRHGAHLSDVSLVFMISGVPNRNTSNATVIDNQFNVRAEERRYLPDEDWARFDGMRKSGRLMSLPYVPWHHLPEVPRLSYDEKRPTIMFRGGNHFLRFIAYLFALRNSCADPASGFQARAYFADDMNPQFRFCEACRALFKQHGDYYPISEREDGDCTSPAPWGGQLDFSVPGLWNNRCPESFYWLSRKFVERHGPIDMTAVEVALNFRSQSPTHHLTEVGRARFYAEAKWEFSINAPQRFWEGASVGTINLLPRRSNDQDYFPVMHDGEHYLTFSDDLSDITADIPKHRFEEITENARRLYDYWIRPSRYAISSNLIDHIFKRIASCYS